jgi:hypothetical protein
LTHLCSRQFCPPPDLRVAFQRRQFRSMQVLGNLLQLAFDLVAGDKHRVDLVPSEALGGLKPMQAGHQPERIVVRAKDRDRRKLAEALHALGERRNCRLMYGTKATPDVDVFNEEAFDLHCSALGKIPSGGSGNDALDVNAKEFDLVAAWSVDRLGRSLTDLLDILQHLHEKRVDLFLHQQGLDTSTSAGKAMFQMLGVFAEFERSIIKERVNAGLARAREKGVALGRPPVKAKVEERIRELHADGMGMLKIGRTIGVGTSVVQRVLAAGT